MKRETRDQILQALDDTARALSGKGFDEGMETVWAHVAWLFDQLRPITTRQQIALLLDRLDNPQPHELAFNIGVIRAIPHLLRDELRQRISNAVNSLPPLPVGRPQTSSERRQEICAYILSLFARKVPLTIAKERAAKKFGVGIRTVERAWRARGEIAPDLDAIRKWLSESLSNSLAPSS